MHELWKSGMPRVETGRLELMTCIQDNAHSKPCSLLRRAMHVGCACSHPSLLELLHGTPTDVKGMCLNVVADARTRCVELRNHHQHLIHDVQAQLQLHPSRVRPEDCGRISSIISRLSVRMGQNACV
eukprot:1159221-Pelagomonas_calceolata.AAC.5